MDDALRGGTLYHLYCAKLIQGWGGDLGENTANSEIGREFLAELDAVSIKHVRLLIKKLVEKSYDKMDPISLTDEDILVAQGACYDQISTVHQLRLECSDLIGEVQKCDGLIGKKCDELKVVTQRLLSLLKQSSTESEASANTTEPAGILSRRGSEKSISRIQPSQSPALGEAHPFESLNTVTADPQAPDCSSIHGAHMISMKEEAKVEKESTLDFSMGAASRVSSIEMDEVSDVEETAEGRLPAKPQFLGARAAEVLIRDEEDGQSDARMATRAFASAHLVVARNFGNGEEQQEEEFVWNRKRASSGDAGMEATARGNNDEVQAFEADGDSHMDLTSASAPALKLAHSSETGPCEASQRRSCDDQDVSLVPQRRLKGPALRVEDREAVKGGREEARAALLGRGVSSLMLKAPSPVHWTVPFM
jgi:hypothetical protein